MDVFANQQTNYNMAIAATSGAGKSFFMNNWIKSYLGIGGQVWVIDAGFSYVKLVELLKGQYIQYGANAQRLCFNPFSKLVHWGSSAGGDDDPSDRADELATLKALHAQMASPSRPLSDVELSFIEEAIMRVLEVEGREGCPDSVHRVLRGMTDPRARDLARVLASYAKGGMYSHLFNGTNNVNFENDFVVLELDGLNEQKQLRSVILLQMQMNIQAVMYKKENRGRRKFVILDEAWDLLSQGGNTAAFFETGARRVRKSGGSMITITQGINDYYDKMRDVGRYLLENAEFVGLLKQKTESIAAFRNNGRIVLSEMEYRLLSSVTKTTEYSEIFMITPFGRGICRLTVPRETQLLFTTNPDELALIDRVRKEGPKELSIDEAIQCIIAAERAQAGADNPRVA
jgi:conjugal transfer ATP-binding protein TraC